MSSPQIFIKIKAEIKIESKNRNLMFDFFSDRFFRRSSVQQFQICSNCVRSNWIGNIFRIDTFSRKFLHSILLTNKIYSWKEMCSECSSGTCQPTLENHFPSSMFQLASAFVAEIWLKNFNGLDLKIRFKMNSKNLFTERNFQT